MLELAKKRQQALPAELASRLVFSQGDVREVRLAKTFDAAISLFHVLSYQVKNDDILNTFATARAHLKPRGFFVFDCWYGPAVLTDLPTVRVKRLEDQDVSVTRIAEPMIRANDDVVDVHYTILICDKSTRRTEEIKETHSMRYFFLPELELMAANAGLKIVGANGWMQKESPSISTWNACFVAQA
jgi:SAM-dependent methyltransferase